MEFASLLQKKTEECNQLIQQYVVQDERKTSVIQEAMQYSVLAGGKRLRPMILLEVFLLFSPKQECYQTAEVFATALELIHTYSLVHDDLPAMDDDQYRRGMLTTHAKYGEAFGVLAGDALLNEAFFLCAKEVERLAVTLDKADASSLRAACTAQRILAEYAGKDGMIKGQELDLTYEGKAIETDQLLLMYELKTSRLLEAAFQIGAVLGGADEQEQQYAYKSASALGRAFQLKDDMLDLIGDEKKLGKPVHSDLKNEKTTYVSLEGFEKTEKEIVRLTEEAIQCLEQLPGEKEFLKTLMLSLINREY